MEQSDLDLVRDLYAEFAEGRVWSRADRWSPDIEFKRIGADAEGVGLAGEWHGIPALVGAFQEWVDVWADMTIEAEEIIELDDGGFLILTHLRARTARRACGPSAAPADAGQL